MSRAVLTIDLEEAHHGVETCSPEQYDTFPDLLPELVPRLLSILERHDARATFFALGCVAEEHPDLIARVAEGGHEIGSHGYDHRKYSSLGPEQVREDLRRSRRAIEAVGVSSPRGFRAPCFSIRMNDMGWFPDMLEAEGFNYDASLIGPGHPFGESGAPERPCWFNGIREAPIPTHRILGVPFPVGGSFFFRLLPYVVSRYLLNDYASRAGGTPILYFHPWELEPGSWPLWWQAGPRAKLVHFWGRQGFEEKFGRLLADFSFVPLREHLED